ncbi:MAG: tetratricopeptide repeat protein [Bacteroidota bacterium]
MVKTQKKLKSQGGKTAKPSLPARETFPVNYYAGIVVALFAFCIYFNSISNDYALDDSAAITDHKYVQQGFRGIPKLMTLDFWYSTGRALGYYRPLSLITYAIEFQFFGLSPHISHLVNVLLFALLVFILFLLMSRVFNGYNLLFPLLTALIFAAHPIHTEIVSNIKGRDEILSLLNILLLLYFAIRYSDTGKRTWLVSGMAAFYLALLSKESAITGIALVPLVLYYSGTKSIVNLAKAALPYLLVIVFFFIQKAILYESVKLTIESENVNYPYFSDLVRSSSAGMLFLFALRILVLPYPLIHDYSYNQLPGVEWTSPWALLGLVVFIALSVWGAMELRKKTTTGFIISNYIILSAPVIGFILIRGGTFAERMLFYPSVGFCMAVAWVILVIARTDIRGRLLKENLLKQPVFIVALLGIMVLLPFSALTINRNKTWKDSMTLFTADLDKGQNCALLQYHWGGDRINEGVNTKDSIKKIQYILEGLHSMRRAAEIFPNFYSAYSRMGDVYDYLGFTYHDPVKVDSAVFCLQEAARLEPDQEDVFRRLGSVYLRLKNYQLASYNYNMALKLNPESAEAQSKVKMIREATGLDIKTLPATPGSTNGHPNLPPKF